jgi:hypothetical protein
MREHHRMIVRWLEGQGASNITIVHKSRHPRVVFDWGGREYRHPVSFSPRCEYRAVRNTVAQLRRLMTQKKGKQN